MKIPGGAEQIVARLERGGFEAYVVGGCVRDSLLGLTPKDWDICTSARPEEMERCLRGLRTVDTGARYGTVTVVLGEERYEVTTFRIDGGYSDNRHPDRVEFVTSITADLARRDFTMNAMAYRPRTGLVDPFCGARALRERTIACVGEPMERFREDALRIMRALRFASVYGFSIQPETADAIHASGWRLRGIAAERSRTELCRLLCGGSVLPVLLDYSDVMAEVIPELKGCIGSGQLERDGWDTVYGHMARAVSLYRGDDPSVRMALLLHDIGEPVCRGEDGHPCGHGAVSHGIARSVLERLRFDRKSRDEILELILYHDSAIEPAPAEVRRWLNRIGPERFRRLLEVRRADGLARMGEAGQARVRECHALAELMEQIVEEGQCFSREGMDIDGRALMDLGVPEGKQVGEMLDALLDEVIGGTLENERGALLARAAERMRSGA